MRSPRSHGPLRADRGGALAVCVSVVLALLTGGCGSMPIGVDLSAAKPKGALLSSATGVYLLPVELRQLLKLVLNPTLVAEPDLEEALGFQSADVTRAVGGVADSQHPWASRARTSPPSPPAA